MTVLKTKDIESALLKKGFKFDITHHKKFWLYFNDKKTSISTHLSHGIREYGDDLLDKVKKQLAITKPQLEAFVKSPLSYKDYVALLQKKRRIDTES